MSDAEKIIALAQKQIGISEEPPGSNNVKYNTIYYGNHVSGDAYAWCVTFIWWLFDQLMLSAEFCGGEKTAYCPYVVNWARNHNAWVTGNYRKGDLVLFDWNGDGTADHIGLVVDVVGSALTTIEGNCGDKVSKMSRNEVSVMGAYRPAYGESKPVETPTAPQTGNIDSDGKYTVKSGDTLWGIAERLLGAGDRYVQLMSANGLKDATIYPGQVLTIPGANGKETKTFSITTTLEAYEILKLMADGWNKTIGEVVEILLEDAK